MQNYDVKWEVTVDALSPVDAALEVAKDYFQERIAQGEPGCACIFSVTDLAGVTTEVALDEVFKAITSQQLQEMFAVGEHPRISMYEWREAVTEETTILGYWEYVQSRLKKGY